MRWVYNSILGIHLEFVRAGIQLQGIHHQDGKFYLNIQVNESKDKKYYISFCSAEKTTSRAYDWSATPYELVFQNICISRLEML